MDPHLQPQYMSDPWSTGYLPSPVHGQYYYSDGHYPPLFPDYYDTFAPVTYQS